MKFKIKNKSTKVILSILLFIAILSLIEWPRGVDQSKVNRCINSYYSNKNGKIINAAYIPLGNRKHGMIVNQYIYVHEDIYTNEDNHLDLQSSEAIPVRVKLISFCGFYKILWCSSPPDGEFYGNVLELLFPKDILNKLDDNMREYGDALSKKTKEQFVKLKSEYEIKNNLG